MAFDKIRRFLLGKPKTAGYRSHQYHRYHTHIRELPLFTFDTIRDMLDDPTIRLGMAMRMAPLCQAEFGVKQGKEWTEGVQADRPDVAKFVHRQIKRLWKFELHKILSAQVWGWSAGEVTYQLDSDNRVEVKGILHRFARDVIALHEDGEVKGARFLRAGKTGNVDLRFPAAFWHAYEPEAESAYGTSALKGAYSPWADKWLDGGALDVRRLFMFKDSYGGVDVAYPPGSTNIDGKGDIPNRDIMREIAEQITAGGVTSRPSEYNDTGKPLWELTRATVPANPQHILQFPKDLDVEMLRGLEIPDDVLTSEGSGAWQGKQVPMQAFYCNADRWLAQVVRTVVTQILEPLVMLNWGRAEEFEVNTKPLAEQAMEQIQASEGDQEMGGQQPGQQGEAAGPFVNVRGKNGNVFQRRNPRFGQQQLSLDDSNEAERLVGHGAVQASHLVEAGRRLLAANGYQRKTVKLGKPKRAGRKIARPSIEKIPTRQESLSRATQSLSLTRDERDLVESLTQ